MQYVSYFAVPFILSLTLTPLVRRFAVKNGFIAYPRADRWHKRPTALLGGISIYLALVFSVLYLGLINKNVLSLFFGGTLLFIVGLLDDKFQLRPYIKLFAQIIAGCIAIVFGVVFGLPVNILLAIPLTLLWIIIVTNSFNLLDNIDGLSAGIAVISSLMLFSSSLIFSNNQLGIYALLLSGAALGFLPYNFNPAKIFMGDSGSMLLGYSLAVVSVSGTRHISSLLITMIIPVLILSVPIFDTLFVMIIRKLQGKSIFEGGKDHTSHHLVTLGLSQKKTVLLLYAISAALGLIAILYSKLNVFIISVITFLSVIILLFFGFFLSEGASYGNGFKKRQGSAGLENNKTILNSIFLYKRRIIEVILDLMLICIAYYSAYFLRFEGSLLPANIYLIRESLVWVILIKMSAFFMFGLYRGVWRYISISDLLTVFKVVNIGSVFSVLFLTFMFRFKDYSRTVLFIDWLILLFLIAGTRVLFRVLGEFLSRMREKGTNILIFGAGDTGEMVMREIKRNKSLSYNAVGFIDDDQAKIGNRIQGVPVLGSREKIKDIVKNYDIKELVIAISSLDMDIFLDIVNICKDCSISYRKIRGILDREEEVGIGKG